MIATRNAGGQMEPEGSSGSRDAAGSGGPSRSGARPGPAAVQEANAHEAFRAADGGPALIFRHTAEALFVRAVGGQLPPETVEKLRQVGIDLTAPLPSSYRVGIWVAGVRVLVDQLYPKLDADEAYRRLGERFMAGYFETLIGKALGAILRMLGPKRVLQRFEQQFRTGNNFTRVDVQFTGDAEAEFWINHTFGEGPGFIVGLLERGIGEAGAKEVKVHPLKMEGLGCRYRMSWRT